jgi:hypothetical protein
MKPFILLLTFTSSLVLSCHSQTVQKQKTDMASAANKFLQTLTPEQKVKTQFPFDDEERYHWHYVPMERKGITLNDMNATQHKAAMDLLHVVLSDKGFEKTTAVFNLENVLKEVEKRPADDKYRDAGNYHFSIFGNPMDSIWGWRLEGHHISFNFSSENNQFISGTPGFIGANPAVVLSGPEKGLEILKEETKLGFTFLNSLDTAQKQKAIIITRAPSDIITGNSRKAVIDNPRGILYSELTKEQKKIFLQLLNLYIQRYKQEFAAKMMKDIEEAGLNNLRFAWAGALQPGVGNPHYYRIQGPTIIIEYDNTQNNANHVHTVIRDLKNDFGGDQLLEHYKNGHHH